MWLRDLGDWQGSGRSVGEGGVRGGSQASSLVRGGLVVQFTEMGPIGRVTCFEGTQSSRVVSRVTLISVKNSPPSL